MARLLPLLAACALVFLAGTLVRGNHDETQTRATRTSDAPGDNSSHRRKPSTTNRAGVRTGDIIIAIDGKRFSEPGMVQVATMTAVLKPSTKSTVVRGDQELVLDINARSIFADRQGAHINPTAR